MREEGPDDNVAAFEQRLLEIFSQGLKQVVRASGGNADTPEVAALLKAEWKAADNDATATVASRAVTTVNAGQEDSRTTAVGDTTEGPLRPTTEETALGGREPIPLPSTSTKPRAEELPQPTSAIQQMARDGELEEARDDRKRP